MSLLGTLLVLLSTLLTALGIGNIASVPLIVGLWMIYSG